MSTEIDPSYQELPYDGGSNASSHPGRLATLGRVFGMNPAAIDSCRVLEIGCSVGTNVIGMAYTLPDSEFTAIDRSPSQIEIARTRAESLGLRNIRFEVADIMDFGAGELPFDYIIALGVFSWVPEPVRDRMLTLCRSLLAPQGIAFMNYNVLPGWYMRQPLRDLMLMAAGEGHAAQRAERATNMLDFVGRAVVNGYPDLHPFGALVERERTFLAGQAAQYIAHEHLEAVNTALYFKDFVSLVGSFGLRYLADAAVQLMFPLELDTETSAELESITTSQVAREQLLDFIRGRQFRQSLLCRDDVAVARDIQPEIVDQFHVVALGAILEDDESPSAPGSIRYKAGGTVLNLTDPRLVAVVRRLTEVKPGSIPASELLGEDPAGRERMRNSLVRLYLGGVIRFEVTPARFERSPGSHPRASKVALATKSGRTVTNLLSEEVAISSAGLMLLPLLDGKRDRAELTKAFRAALRALEPGHKLRQLLEPGADVESRIERELGALAASALLLSSNERTFKVAHD